MNYDTLLFDLETTDEGANRASPTAAAARAAPTSWPRSAAPGRRSRTSWTASTRVETREDAQAYVARLEAFARIMDEEIERVRRDVGLGVIPPDYAITGALGGHEGAARAGRTSRRW